MGSSAISNITDLAILININTVIDIRYTAAHYDSGSTAGNYFYTLTSTIQVDSCPLIFDVGNTLQVTINVKLDILGIIRISRYDNIIMSIGIILRRKINRIARCYISNFCCIFIGGKLPAASNFTIQLYMLATNRIQGNFAIFNLTAIDGFFINKYVISRKIGKNLINITNSQRGVINLFTAVYITLRSATALAVVMGSWSISIYIMPNLRRIQTSACINELFIRNISLQAPIGVRFCYAKPCTGHYTCCQQHRQKFFG